MKIRVYGPSRGHASWPRVAKGLCEGLAENDALTGFVATDELGHDLDGGMSPGYDAPVGVYVGPPTLASVMRGCGQHRHRLALIAVNSTFVPRIAMHSLERDEAVTGYLAPSAWAAERLRTHTDLPVYLWQHGVSRAFAQAWQWATRGPGHHWRVLHLASTNGSRKGTVELIEAWAELLAGGEVPYDSELELVCDGPREFFSDAIEWAIRSAGYDDELEERLRRSYYVRPRYDLPESATARMLYQHDLVVQPSRGEGFGLVPLEARAVGTPVAMTTCTGHAEHALGTSGLPAAGVVEIETGSLGPIDDGPEAMAPTLRSGHIRSALAEAYRCRGDLALLTRSAAPLVMESWSWKAVTRRFLDTHGELE